MKGAFWVCADLVVVRGDPVQRCSGIGRCAIHDSWGTGHLPGCRLTVPAPSLVRSSLLLSIVAASKSVRAEERDLSLSLGVPFPGTRATRRLVLSSTAESAVNGWISLRAEGDSRRQDVAAAFFYNLSGDSGLSDSTGVGPSVLGDRFFFPVQQSETPATVLTGVAVRSVTDPLTLLLFDDQGGLVDETILSADQAILVGELFPDQPADFVGSIEVSSGFPFYLLVVRVEVTQSNGVQLTSIPATLVP